MRKKHFSWLPNIVLLMLFLGLNVRAQQLEYSLLPMEVGPPHSFTPITAADTHYVFSRVRNSVALAGTNRHQAIELNTQAMQYSLQKNIADGVGLTMMNAGFFEVENGSVDAGIKYFMKAYPYCLQAKYYPHLLAKWYINIGGLYFFSGDYKRAAQANHKAVEALSRSDLVKYAPIFVQAYNNASGLFLRMKQYDLASKYIHLAEQIAVKQNLQTELAYIWCNKGELYINDGLYDDANTALHNGLKIAFETKDIDVQLALYNTLGDLMLAQNKPNEAIPFLLQASKRQVYSSPANTAVFPTYNLGLAHYQLKDYAKAEAYMLAAIEEAKTRSLIDYKEQIHKALSDIYAETGQYQKALEEQKIYEKLKDSLFTKNKLRDINELEIKYNSAQKDKDITSKQLTITQQNVDLQQKSKVIWVSVIGVLFLASSTFWIYRNNRHKQNIMASKLNILEQGQEIKLLRASINGEEQERIRIGRELHDGIGGLLSAVKLRLGSLRLKHDKMNDEQDFMNAISLVDEATSEVRKTAHNLMPEVLLKGGVEEAVQSFCERIRTENAPDIRLQCYGTIPRLEASAELSIYRIIQELVNNILKHAQATQALIQLNWQSNILHLSVEDNGKGMDVERKRAGVGIANIKARVAAMHGNFEIESQPLIGTTIYIDWDFNNMAITEITKNV